MLAGGSPAWWWGGGRPGAPIRGADSSSGRSLTDGRRRGEPSQRKKKSNRATPKVTTRPTVHLHDRHPSPPTIHASARAWWHGGTRPKKINERMEEAEKYKQKRYTTHARQRRRRCTTRSARRLVQGKTSAPHSVGGAPAPGSPTAPTRQPAARQAGHGGGAAITVCTQHRQPRRVGGGPPPPAQAGQASTARRNGGRATHSAAPGSAGSRPERKGRKEEIRPQPAGRQKKGGRPAGRRR